MSDVLINKKPLDEYERILPTKNFPHMPILYLEFLENKTKVRKEYINKNYIPSSTKKTTKHSTVTQGMAAESGAWTNTDGRVAIERSKNPEVTISDVLDDDTREGVVHATGEDRTFGSNHDEGETDHEKIIDHQLNSLLGEDRPIPQEPEVEEKKSPPTLEELQQKKKMGTHPQVTISRDYRYAEEEDEETQKERNAVYFKYEVLRRMHPNANIPEFTIYSDPKLMAQKYELLTKKLSLESSVDSWKRYMIVFVMGCEVVLGKLSFDMEGFAQQQIMSMSTYDQLLVEMAEKSYVPSGSSKWSPEVRLFMMLTMNIVLFVISKMIFKKTGTNLLGTINDLTSPQERKMKEPSNE